MFRWLRYTPALILGAGLIGSTLLAVLVPGDWVMAGPVVFAGFVLAAGWLARRERAQRGPGYAAVGFSAAVILACALVAVADPLMAAAMIPIVGAPAASVVGNPTCRSC